jgi:acyl-CoA synthetase (AMP-forming)/AMP-acid ligase II
MGKHDRSGRETPSEEVQNGRKSSGCATIGEMSAEVQMPLLVGGIIDNAARVEPHAVAATLGDDSLTFGALDSAANRVARVLDTRGVRGGDRVAWWGDTALEAIPVFGALARIGAVFAPVNARIGLEEALPIVELVRPRLLLTDSTHDEAGHELAARLGIEHVGGELADLAAHASSSPLDVPGPDEHDPHVIFFTSGSTGRPKGVVLSHRTNWLRSFPGATTEPGGGGVVCMFPLFHMAGWTIALGAWQGRRAVHFSPADPATLLETAQRHRAGRLYAIPAVWARILEHGVGGYDLSTLREADTGTSATPPELIAAIKEALPHTVTRIFYGSTEAGPATILPDGDLAAKAGGVGRPQPGCEVRLSETGEVCVRNPFLMDGYFDDPAATAEALRDGWYHTGDLGAFDADGYLSIVGRARDVIRSGGETISPVEIEQVLASHPACAEVAVVGVPDPSWGEIVTACIVVRAGSEPPDVESLRTWCSDRVASFKHPRRVVVLEALPRTPATGQVQRTLIVERLITGASDT